MYWTSKKTQGHSLFFSPCVLVTHCCVFFLRYLVKNSSSLFSASDYEVAPPEYHRKAVWRPQRTMGEEALHMHIISLFLPFFKGPSRTQHLSFSHFQKKMPEFIWDHSSNAVGAVVWDLQNQTWWRSPFLWIWAVVRSQKPCWKHRIKTLDEVTSKKCFIPTYHKIMSVFVLCAFIIKCFLFFLPCFSLIPLKYNLCTSSLNLAEGFTFPWATIILVLVVLQGFFFVCFNAIHAPI